MSPQQWLDINYPLPPSRQFFGEFFRSSDAPRRLVPLVVLYLAWPWATMGVLQIFSASMRKARVRKTHVLRCIIYSADIAAWAAILALTLTLTGFAAGAVLGYRWIASYLPWFSVGSLLLFVAIGFWYRLGTAYRTYLKFDHPFLTIVSSQIIVFLAFLYLIAINDLQRF